MIKLKNVMKTYATPGGSLNALDNVTFEVKEGEFIAVVGASGAGKSTLLFTIAGLVTPTAGRVSVAGESIYEKSASFRARLRRERLGFVFQTFHLLPYLS
ncbi:unnamed protein product, partial [marine sediment metagenome]